FINKSNYTPSIPPSSIDSRVAIYQSTEKIIKNNFFIGIGPLNFQEQYLSYQKYFNPYPQWAVPHAHNVFLHIFAEFGFFALIPFLGLIYLKIFKNKTKKPREILVFSILIYFIIHGLVDTTIWQNDTALLFWVFLLLI
ncbi:MAG: O-antigen ligase family protein, partial [Patescibacteria group bacterium]|nr:O-antigen ligase family protein [Patescibacteria group bacterium]